MIFLMVYLLLYVPLVVSRARLRELNGDPGHVNRNGIVAFLVSMPLGALSPPLWLLTLLALFGYQAVRATRELRSRQRQVRYLRGKGPRPVPRAAPGEDA